MLKMQLPARCSFYTSDNAKTHFCVSPKMWVQTYEVQLLYHFTINLCAVSGLCALSKFCDIRAQRRNCSDVSCRHVNV
jgi:hypothetical protein